MNQEIKAKWINALRSGNYAQTSSALTRIDASGNKAHCCLGVVCEIGVSEGVLISVDTRATARYTGKDDAEFMRYESAVLPAPAVEWLGVKDRNPEIQIGTYYDVDALVESLEGAINYTTAFFQKEDGTWWTSLATLNDAGATFNDIATVIEERF